MQMTFPGELDLQNETVISKSFITQLPVTYLGDSYSIVGEHSQALKDSGNHIADVPPEACIHKE